MNLDREWTPFAADAEVDAFGTGRMVAAHNALRSELAALKAACAEMAAALMKYRRKLPAYMGVRIDPRVIGDCHGTADAALARYRNGSGRKRWK